MFLPETTDPNVAMMLGFFVSAALGRATQGEIVRNLLGKLGLVDPNARGQLRPQSND